MNDDDRIDRLTKQVEALTVQVTALQQELTKNHRGHRHSTEKTTTYTTPTVSQTTTILQPGDRIRILNTIKKPITWPPTIPWIPSAAKAATVTAVINNRIYFTTDNGVHTWGSRRNILLSHKP
jgi:hypothetical protein